MNQTYVLPCSDQKLSVSTAEKVLEAAVAAVNGPLCTTILLKEARKR